jgi:hypothetical protein
MSSPDKQGKMKCSNPECGYEMELLTGIKKPNKEKGGDMLLG